MEHYKLQNEIFMVYVIKKKQKLKHSSRKGLNS